MCGSGEKKTYRLDSYSLGYGNDAMGTRAITPKTDAFSAPALLVAGAFFMEFLDGTVIATALPDMAKDFGVAAVALNIGISAYLSTIALICLVGMLDTLRLTRDAGSTPVKKNHNKQTCTWLQACLKSAISQ